MRHINAALFGLLASVVVAAGCNSADPSTSTDPTAETSAKNVRMSLTAQGSADASVKLHVFSKITLKEVYTQSLNIKGGATTLLQLGLDSDDYTIKADVYADVEQTIVIGTSSTDCSVKDGHMSEISLVINTEIKGSVGISINANDAPLIGNVAVKLNTAADIAATIHVDASDSDGKNLHYFWSGFCIDGTIEGSATLDISVDLALAALAKGGDHKITVVVQDELGATAHASIDLKLDLGVDVGVGTDTGTDTNNDSCTDASVKIELDLCLDLHASCTAKCKVAAAASLSGATALVGCLLNCGLELTTCNDGCGCDAD